MPRAKYPIFGCYSDPLSPVRLARIAFAFALLLPSAQLSAAGEAPPAPYAGPEVCSKCHKDIAATQSSTAMAKTWKGALAPSLPANFDEQTAEGPDPALHYEVLRRSGGFEFSVVSRGEKTVLPVQAIIGGDRHGISFLPRITELDGIPLARSALLEGRYAASPHGSLVLSPGFQKEKPSNLEDTLGRVLSPAFERRCLTCHGQPHTLGAGSRGGVRCESCHGAAGAHVASMQAGNGEHSPVLPQPLTGAKVMDICGQCHTGLSAVTHADPVPADLLVSNQVRALRNSQCFIQSGEAVTCTDCHNPHRDSANVAETSVKTCLHCHSLDTPRHAGICPINAKSGCIQCHMPSINSNGFRLVDHWIGVHPEQGIKADSAKAPPRSLIAPKREYLQIIVTENRANAEAARQRLDKGDSFYDVAHDLSIDGTAPGGGFTGETRLADMDAHLAEAAAALPYGGVTGIIDEGNRFIILHRLPRDFKWQADQLYRQAVALKDQGDRKAAIEKDESALRVYPYFLRALVFMGTAFAEAGNAARAQEVLGFAVQSYPQDASAQFDYALTLAKRPAEQIQALRHVIELDPDFVAAYESLGAALASAGQVTAAIGTFRAGLSIDPLSAILNYDLGLALKLQGGGAGAKQALELAGKLDPEIAARVQASRQVE